MVWEDAGKCLAQICMKKMPMAHLDNKTTEEERGREEEAGWEESAASLIISGKSQKMKTLPIGTGLINKVLSERRIRGKREREREWLDSIFPKDCLQSLKRGY